MNIIQEIDLSLNSEPPYNPVRMRQTDNGRTIKANIYSDGISFVIPSGSAVEFNARTPSGVPITRTQGVRYSSSTIYVDVDANTLAEFGDVRAELVITGSDSNQIGTVNFIIRVWGGAVTPRDLQAQPDYQSVQQAKQQAEAAARQAEQAAQAAADKAAAQAIVGIQNRLYPVGSYYISSAATSPATLFGFGTWVRASVGKALFGVDTTDTDFNTPGKTGGSKTLRLPLDSSGYAQIVSGMSSLYSNITGVGSGWSPSYRANLARVSDTSTASTATPLGGTTGQGAALPPYETVYIWRRTA